MPLLSLILPSLDLIGGMVLWLGMKDRASSPRRMCRLYKLVCLFLLAFMGSIQTRTSVTAKALYPYEATSANQLSFAEGDKLGIVDASDPDWWKAEVGGVILFVPASYVEFTEGQ